MVTIDTLTRNPYMLTPIMGILAGSSPSFSSLQQTNPVNINAGTITFTLSLPIPAPLNINASSNLYSTLRIFSNVQLGSIINLIA